MRLPTSCATKKAPARWCRRRSRSLPPSRPGRRCVVLTPELLTRMSIGPTSVSACATADLMLSMVGHVERDHVRVAALGLDLGAQFLQRSMRRAGQHDRGAGARQRLGELRAQAAGGAGDEGDSACQIDAVAHGGLLSTIGAGTIARMPYRSHATRRIECAAVAIRGKPHTRAKSLSRR